MGLKSALYLEAINTLEVLDLVGNKISEFNDVESLAKIPNLKQLLLIGNPISKKNSYRQIILHRLPRLLVLDDRKVLVEERAEQTQDPLIAPSAGLQVMVPGLCPVKVPIKINSMSFELESEKTSAKGKPKRVMNMKEVISEGAGKFIPQETKGNSHYLSKANPGSSYTKKHIPKGYGFK